MANKWTSFNNIPSGFQPETMILLTDGSVLVHNSAGNDWRRLTPDSQGKYESGTWSAALKMTNTRQYFASGVLMDGRVFAIGGETSDAGRNTSLAEIFDPLTNTWSSMNKPVAFNWINGDAVGCILTDGRVLLGALLSSRTAIWDPASDTWTEAGLAFGASITPTKVSRTNEETWTLLPDGTVLNVEVFNTPAAEKYVPSTDRWVSAGKTSSTLALSSIFDQTTNTNVGVSEIGPAVVLPDGRLFAVGGTGHTALYTPPANPAQPGTWAAGPDTPADTSSNNFNQANGNIQTAIDAPCCLLPNGKVLLVAGNTVRETNQQLGFWSNPSTCYIYDPATNGISQLSPQPPSNTNDTWTANFLLLPTGQVLFSSQQGALAILTLDPASGTPKAAWKPSITIAPSTMVVGHTYVISGTQFNGLSQACSYGDDAQMATNYPIVRLTNTATNRVVYLRSFNFSSLGIATGSATQTASVQLPAGAQPGQYQMVVIANGISSDPISVQVVAQDCFFIVDRSTYGQGEIQALINLNGAPAVIDPALYVVVEGFKPSDLGLTHANLGNPPNKPSIPGPVSKVSLEFSGQVIPEDPLLPSTPQRFTFPYRIVFQDTTMFNFVPTIEPLTLNASLTAAGTTVTSSAGIELIKNPNPFILHGDAAHGYPWILSVDTRVFQMKAGQTSFGAHVGSLGAARDVATTFIQQVITNLNGSPASAGALFDALPQNENVASLALAPSDVNGVPVYNFALARVRYRDVIPANNVRVFFRMWPAQQTNATYDTNTLYRSSTNAGGQKTPLLGVIGDEIMTVPFFANKRVDTTSVSMVTQTDAPNIRATINPDAIGGEVDSYYGCWLDINQPNDQVFPSRMVGPNPANIPDGPFTGMGTLLSIQQLVRSQHQCLLAEVSFDPDPIPSNADPSNSDKLAQRNLTFVNVANPGLIGSRRVPQTFEVRPTPRFLASDHRPDELMIEWGNTPSRSIASIYLPAVDADEILKLAGEMYATHRLIKTDEHTVECPTGGITYVPIPQGSGTNFAGLLTVDLPAGIKRGEVHGVTVKQVTSAFRRGEVVIEIQKGRKAARAEQDGNIEWRRVLGVFHLTIPVSTKEVLLAPEERLLSVLRWIEQSIPLDSRWYLVFQRYVDQVAGRVQDMGGDPDQIGPDPDGKGHKRHRRHKPEGEELVAFRGKIVGLAYDRFGDFSGFLLDTEDGERHFESREQELEELVERAWAKRINLTVYAERHDPDRALRIVLRGPVSPLEE